MRLLKKIISSVLFFLTLLSQSFATITADVQAGGKLAATCAACHGPNGNSAVPIYPKLAGQNQQYFIAQMKSFQQGPSGLQNNPMMESIAKNLSPKQIHNLAAYFAQQTVKMGHANADTNKLGEQIYQLGIPDEKIAACYVCHGSKGISKVDSPYPNLSGQHADYVLQQLEAFKNGSRKSSLNGIMSAIAQQLNKKQMQAVATYIVSLQ